MRYLSTRGQAPITTLDAALAAGLAPDGGLYVPEVLPHFAIGDFDGLDTLPEIAARLLAPFFAGSRLQAQLQDICNEALDLPIPIVPLGSGEDRVLELFHGPTAAFKDFAARFLAACLARLRAPDEPLRTVLVATSGDTGGAVAAAFHRRPGFRVVILYPDGRVSARQAHQLAAFGDNIVTYKVDGSFDDCQRLVKSVLGDVELARSLNLTSANSISLGRLLPQMAYYAYTAIQIQRSGQSAPTAIIPSGNLGNALAAIVVREMGLPWGEIVLATNANRTLSDYFAGADYQGRPSIATLANAMDVGDPSNFERLRWWFKDRDLRHSNIQAHWVDDATIEQQIKVWHSRTGTAFCPHTACALAVRERLPTNNALIVATAHPAKFNEIVEPLIGRETAVPPALAQLLAQPAHALTLTNDRSALVAALR